MQTLYHTLSNTHTLGTEWESNFDETAHMCSGVSHTLCVRIFEEKRENVNKKSMNLQIKIWLSQPSHHRRREWGLRVLFIWDLKSTLSILEEVN